MDEAKIAVEVDAAQCAICRSKTQSGTKLCAHCRAARHRAFAETVTRPHPAVGSVSARARELRAKRKTAKLAQRASAATVLAERNAAQAQSSEAANDASRRLGARHLGIAIGVVLLACGIYAAYRALSTDPGARNDPARADVSSPPMSPAVAAKSAAAPDTAVAPVAAPRTSPAGAVPAPVPVVAPAGDDLSTSRAFAGLAAKPVVPVLSGTSKPANTKAPARTKQAAVAAIPDPPPEVIVPAAPAPIAIAPVPVREAPKPDKWQVMNAALARCGGEGVLSRFTCEQRVRLQYCEGAWGQVSQCVSGPINDHGQ